MKIIRIEPIPVCVPLKKGLTTKTAHGEHVVSPYVIVRVHTDEGLVGLGEATVAPRWTGETSRSCVAAIEELIGPALLGKDPSRITALRAVMDRELKLNPFTKAAVEMALWDLAGKATGKPVYELLGGKVREHVATKWSVSGRPPAEAAAIARWAMGRGFRTMKVKVGLGPDADVERVAAVRDVIGPAAKLGVDANGGWGDSATAIAAIARLKLLGIDFAEQPVWAGDPEEMAAVRRSAGLPIVADESLYTLADAKQLVRAGACDVFSIYVGKAGGLGPAKAIADFALEAGIACTIGSNLELGVGSAAMIHLGLAHRGIMTDAYPCDIIGPFFYEDDFLTEPLVLDGGRAVISDRPGLGVELDEGKVERYRIR
jgi:L-alanine-DL-glutamate epimerase-like enolase superfamily enzyme